MNIFPPSLQLKSQALDAYSLRHKTIASNIANVDTPNYKSQQVRFESELKKALADNGQMKANRTSEKHVTFKNEQGSMPMANVVRNNNTMFNHNGNNVDLDKEMANLAKNQINYNAMIDRVNGTFNRLQMVISEGR